MHSAKSDAVRRAWSISSTSDVSFNQLLMRIARRTVRPVFWCCAYLLAFSCFVGRGEESLAAALTLDEPGFAPARVTSLLAGNFSISVTLDLPAGVSSESLAGGATGYRRLSVASIQHLAAPETSTRLVLFRNPVRPGLASLTWGNFQAGYGQVFPNESVITRGNNGTAWEAPGCLYLKTCFRF
jgi:hypothetical protein